MMGGAADIPLRSSSPLKRPASELEQENPAKDKEDVDMEGIEISKEVPDSSNQGPDANGNGETQISQLQEPASQDTDTCLPEADGEMSEDVPPIDEQIRRVKELHEAFESQPLTPGTKTYIISNTWLDNVQAHASGAKLSNAEPVGPVDNADIVYEILTDQNQQPFARLKHEVVGGSVAYFPEAAWNLVVQWHGLKAGQVPIIRQAVDTSMDPEVPNVQFELHPVVFKIHRLWAVSSPLPISQILKAKNPPAPIFIMSRNDRFQDFLKSIKKSANIETQQTVRVWTVPIFSDEKTAAAAPAGGASPPLSRAGTPAPDAKSAEDWTKLLVEAATFNGLTRGAQREIVDTKDYTNDPKYNGRSTIAMTGLGKDQALVLDELIEGNTYLATYAQKVAKQGTKGIATGSANTNRATAVSRPDSGRSSPAPSVPMTRGRVQKSSGKTVGTVGLANLGNTCYMNSALQCIRSVEELTKYFLADEAEKELNTENPLGKGGNVALVYNALLRELYKEPPPSSITPRQFKNTFGRYFGSFSGYGQQDSQEFLGILLDALQEDLNRVKKKPYIEKPDSTDEMVDNPAALKKMAKEVWDITKRRDDSVIGDLFTGMYKSTLVCPDCAKVSITFDPFSTVTMQLPIESTWGHEVFFFPLNDKPVRVAVDMDKQGSIKGLKTFVSSRVDVPVERLFIAEEFNNQIYRILEDTKSVSEDIQANDRIMVFELEAVPTNWPPVRKPKQKTRSMLNVSYSYQDDDEGDIPSWDSPRAERMIVPVISRRQNPNPTRFGKPLMHAYAPFFITLTPEEARSEDIIQRKILERVANLTTYNMSGYETDDDQSAEQDIVITTASDTSSGDGKVVATSIDGEDDVVDVTVTEQNNRPAEVDGQKDSNPRKRKFQSRRPKWIDPEQFLPSEYNNLFELSYFSSKKEVVPTGWGVVDEEKLYPRLSSRIPVVQDAVEVDDEASDGFASNNPQRSDGESSEDDIGDIPQLAPTRMNEESSDDDDLAPNTRVLPVRPIAQHAVYKVGQMKAFRRGIRTYSRKGNKRTPQRARMSSEEVEEDANPGPLVRLGEGIVVDWYQDPFATLFEGDQEDTMRGRECWSSVGLLEDPVLEAKRKSRLRRRSKGLSLDECLDEFGKEEILSEMDTWYCPRCKEHRRASKKLELWRTPDIMVFHLKRFSSTAMRRDKLDIQVTFPIDGLDMSTRVLESEDGKKDIYDLFAVDNHYGSLGGGHYTAYAKSFVDGAWYDYNDSAVSKLKDPSHVISSAAYLLFYRRRSDRPLGGPRFEEILARFDNPPATSEDESSGSGEGQRLGADSSLRGSPSALTGVEATRQAGHGSVTGTTAGTTVATRSVTNTSIVPPSAIDSPPDYKDALEDDGAPLLERDAIMNDGIEMRDASGDEAIDLGSAYDGDFPGARVGGMEPNWNFSALAQPYSHNNYPASATSVELGSVGARSDDVQHDSSASEGSMAGRLADFDAADVDEDYVDQDPVPDLDEDQVDLLSLHGELGDMQARRRYEEVVPEVPGSEGEAAEIHVHEGEGVN
ncbi:CSN-associated deubiquitinating enzyme Ubp12 [Pseudogymnoascus verrucosus]|uniref:ubiquitinyl hydrolase 1 n=1 Tax=Pseudogymnoascus verrucosus TaxID=342668 RepID=A0A1B8GUQ5_9PEZI|nr:CSN-associated deubiquitinating enzyme Ubp12 [Pseudogymnoascus verrucosus]OBT99530.2 CSN-associated deubiquitinating enzyme Ubp12 [Pseudogymnoascus verrucosus]